jgi:hypothetical protein
MIVLALNSIFLFDPAALPSYISYVHRLATNLAVSLGARGLLSCASYNSWLLYVATTAEFTEP